jgi:hypothetical protein
MHIPLVSDLVAIALNTANTVVTTVVSVAGDVIHVFIK